MTLTPQTHIRLARPSLDLSAAERFYVDKARLQVLYRHLPQHHEEALLMLGLPGAGWHLELPRRSEPLSPTLTAEDLLVLYLGQPAPESTLQRLQAHGGVRVPALNPYWDTWGSPSQTPTVTGWCCAGACGPALEVRPPQPPGPAVTACGRCMNTWALSRPTSSFSWTLSRPAGRNTGVQFSQCFPRWSHRIGRLARSLPAHSVSAVHASFRAS